MDAKHTRNSGRGRVRGSSKSIREENEEEAALRERLISPYREIAGMKPAFIGMSETRRMCSAL